MSRYRCTDSEGSCYNRSCTWLIEKNAILGSDLVGRTLLAVFGYALFDGAGGPKIGPS